MHFKDLDPVGVGRVQNSRKAILREIRRSMEVFFLFILISYLSAPPLNTPKGSSYRNDTSQYGILRQGRASHSKTFLVPTFVIAY